MLRLFEDSWFTFRFADDRIIQRIHLEGVVKGQTVSVYQIDPATGERLGLLAIATAGEAGWVDLATPLVMRSGSVFIAVPSAKD